ncbi:MAG: hypothetical protein ACJ8AI_16850 [Rhodopila sp.]
MTPAWGADWAWSVPLTVLTLAIHIVSITGIAILLTRAGTLIERWKPGPIPASLLVAAAVGGVGGSLMALLALEAAVWAAAYLLLGAVGTVADAMLYSIDSITTRGASGLELQPHWKMMGALEAVNGVLLFGISTAFLASVITEARTLLGRLTGRPRTNALPIA